MCIYIYIPQQIDCFILFVSFLQEQMANILRGKTITAETTHLNRKLLEPKKTKHFHPLLTA